jgi:XTP/dITP diphosphohydrolase
MKLVFATNNKNKVKEIKALLPTHFELLSLKDIGCTEEILETENTLEGNAKLKATYIYKNYGFNCFADDTGLEVDALNGEPGVFSARYSGAHATSNENMNKLLLKLEDIENRKAQFETVIALNRNGKLLLFKGICKGEISRIEKGMNGFGYDPIFEPEGFDKSFAEMSLEEKGLISHRGLAVEKLVDFLRLHYK